MLRLSNRIVPLSQLTSNMSTTITTKGVAAAVLKNSKFRLSSVLVSNSLTNSTNKFNNKLTRQRSIFRLSSLMNSHNSFHNSFSTIQSSKIHATHSKKNSNLRNNSTSISSSSTKDSSLKTSSEETIVIEGRSMTEKFKILTKKYGVSAVAVYLIISALDLGLTFILIQIGGADRVKKVEDWFADTFGDWIILRKNSPKKEEDSKQINTVQVNTSTPNTATNNAESDTDEYVVDSNSNRTSNTPSWASTLVIAYGIHKLLVPLRLGLTAAITPAIARKLKRMGWNIGGKHL